MEPPEKVDRDGDSRSADTCSSDAARLGDPDGALSESGETRDPRGGCHDGEAAEAAAAGGSEPVGPVQFAPRRSRTERVAERRRKRRWRRITGWSMVGVGLAIVITIGWVAFRTFQAYRHLEAAASVVSQIESQAKAIGDIRPDELRSQIDRLRVESARARSATADPLYKLASRAPWVGQNLSAIRVMAITVDDVSRDAVPPLLAVARLSTTLTPRGGHVDLAPVIDAAASLQSADAAVNAGRARMSALDRGALFGPVDRAVLDLRRKLDQAAALTSTGARVGRLAPAMLGADGERWYLLVFQNPAELRATGGIFGSFVLVRVNQGSIAIVDQGASSRSIGDFDAPVVQLSPEARQLYTDLMGTSPVDVNFTPDFPTAANTFASMYAERTGRRVDGVIGFDPVAASYLLKGHPPIPVGDGVELTADNMVQVLLSKAYAMFPATAGSVARDAFLSGATQGVFAAIVSGDTDAATVLHGLQKAAQQRRLLIWSAHPSEEADLAPTTLSGRLVGSVGTNPVVGVYFNDGTGAKLDYYLYGDVAVVPGTCLQSAGRTLNVTVTMNYTAPDHGLPDYVLGLATPGTPYVLRTNVLIVAPAGGTTSRIDIDGRPVPVKSGVDHGLSVGMVTVDLRPGQSAVVTAVVTAARSAAPAGQQVHPVVSVTPGVQTWPASAKPYAACR